MKITQEMLHNQNSAYYTLVKNLACLCGPGDYHHLRRDLGYDGCTKGAKTIREMESKRHFNIPWSLSLLINADKLETEPDFYPFPASARGFPGDSHLSLVCSQSSGKGDPLLAGKAGLRLYPFSARLPNERLFPKRNGRRPQRHDFRLCGSGYAGGLPSPADSRMLYAVHQRYTEADKEQILSGMG